MGELIKILERGKLKGIEFDIELNKPSKKGLPRSIHIQNDVFRVEFDEIEFLNLATTYLSAKKQFLSIKGEL
jgi:hypothetical protein